MKFIESSEELRTVYKHPSENAIRKELRVLDHHARNFLARCPIVFIGSQDGAGHGDVTPKGDKPGFVGILDDITIAIPDRPGNNRLDTWENILVNPAIGLLFLVPGMDETLRVNGQGRLTADAELCAQFGVDGRPAQAVLVVRIEGLFFHCAKAFMRSQLWKPDTWPSRRELPTLGQIMRDQLELGPTPAELDAAYADAYRKSLW